MCSKTEATCFHPDEGRGARCRATAEEDKEGRNRRSHEFNDGNHDRFPTGKGSLASGGRDGDGEEERKTNYTAQRRTQQMAPTGRDGRKQGMS